MPWFQLKRRSWEAAGTGRGGEPRARAFRDARSGNVTILFALSLLPMIGFIGLGVDYGVALSEKAKLDNAADAAAIAAVATAKAYVVANSASQGGNTLMNNAEAAGYDRGMRAFAVNAGSLPFASTPTPAISWAGTSGQTYQATVSYSTTSTNNFGRLFGQNTTAIGGGTSASANIPSYLDFYLLVDVSGSMGLPSTPSGQNSLIAINTQAPDPFPNTTQGCVFACHFPGYHGWTLATQNKIQLRSGAVNTAVCGLLSSAAQPTIPNQYRVGLYPFITQMGTLSAISSTLTNANIAADCASNPPMAFTNLLDTGTTQKFVWNNPTTGTGSGGTNFGQVLPAMQSTISSAYGYGNGSAPTNSQPFVFLITDGMQNGQLYGVPSGNTEAYPGSPSTFNGYGNANFTGSTPQAMNPSLCSNLKSAGAIVSILYIPYLSIQVNPDPYNENGPADNAIPNIPAALSNCASPTYFYTANSPSDISNALLNMFQHALQYTHLTK